MKLLYKSFKAIIFISIICNSLFGYTQNDFKSFTNQIIDNNNEFKVLKALAEERKVEIKTGIYPSDPNFGFEYMLANDGNGASRKFSITQEFDFPTTYIIAKKLRKAEANIVDLYTKTGKQELITNLSTELVNYLILRDKLHIVDQELTASEKLLSGVNQQFENGEINILELNKMRLYTNKLKNQKASIENTIQTSLFTIYMYNNGESIDLTALKLPDFELDINDDFINNAVKSDPEIQSLKAQLAAANEKTRLAKHAWAPSFEVGVGSEKYANEGFKGIIFGMNIPLWEKKNTVALSKSKELSIELSIQSELNNKISIYKNSNITALSNRKMLEDIQASYKNFNSKVLLKKSLDAGQISIIDYLRETNDYFSMELDILDVKYEYYNNMILANKYRLAN